MTVRILVVDDQKRWRDAIRRYLLRTNYELVFAEHIDDAENLLKQHEFTLVILNMNLIDNPDMPNDSIGFDLLDIIMTKYPSLPRVVLTGDLQGPILDTFLPFGVTEVLHKSKLTRSDLRKAIDKCVQQNKIEKKPYERSSLCEVLDEHTHHTHFSRLLRKLSDEFPSEEAFRLSYKEIPGRKKQDKFNYVVDILESYRSVHIICHGLLEIKPDDSILARKFAEIDFTETISNDVSGNGVLIQSEVADQGENNKELFDVFLCHNSEDKPMVKSIGEKLRNCGLKPWLDEWELPPGLLWQELVEEQIEEIKAAAVFVGKSGLGPWQAMEVRGLLSEFVGRNIPVIPVILDNAPKKPKLPLFLREMTWVDFRKDDPDPMEQLRWGITGKKESQK